MSIVSTKDSVSSHRGLGHPHGSSPHAFYEVVEVQIVPSFTFHLGIMTRPARSLEHLANHIGMWSSGFLQSRYSGGMHFVSERKVSITTMPPAIGNLSNTSRIEMPARLSLGQAVERITSVRYFLTHTAEPFCLFTTANVYI
jgi:hypothetical protein